MVKKVVLIAIACAMFLLLSGSADLRSADNAPLPVQVCQAA